MSLSNDQLQQVDVHLAQVKRQIIAAADAAERDGGPIDIPQLGSILSTFSRTKPIPVAESAWAQIIAVPGIIWISALLALIFGVLSIWYAGLSDIAKVFAGAVVGAAGAMTRR